MSSRARNLARIIADNNGEIAAGNLANAVPADGSITAAKLAAGAAATNIGTGGVSSSMLAAGAAATNIGTGGVSSSMLAAGSAVSNIGYTPANVAGATFTGNVNVSGAIVATGNVTAYGSV
jgi:hypothetical protein